MADDSSLLIGKWTVWVKDWVWEYEFFPNKTVKWKDTRSYEQGSGQWSLAAKYLNLSWPGSETKESWQRPLSAARNKKTWYTAPYFNGAYQIEKKVEAPPAYDTPDDFTVYLTDDGSSGLQSVSVDPQNMPNYIDRICTHVAYGIYNGGFWVYVPPEICPQPIEIPEKWLWFQNSGKPVSNEIYGNPDDAFNAVRTVNPNSIAYYGTKIVCPTAFTYRTAPTIVNTANLVVDELIATVTDELKDIMMMLVLRVAVSTGGAIINRNIEVRRLKAREQRAQQALRNARERNLVPTVATARPRATPSQLREMLANSDDWYVWATQESGIVENQEIIVTKKTNVYENEKIHLLRGNNGIKGLQYGPNKVAIRIGDQHISHFTGNEYMTDPIPANKGLHFYHTDLPK